jgi:lia operon protein LiaF
LGGKINEKSMALFIVIEALLAIFLLWQLSSNPAMLIMLLFGVLNIYWAMHKHGVGNFS